MMARPQITVKLKVRVRWWVKHYIQALAIVAWTTGKSPDYARVGKFISTYGCKIEVVDHD